ncbi:nuclear receptor-binding protein homolog [Orussus abietinus]|uniref:nuclear receptor-binding protein homolog n=1 Tax=Orussus abietinus TaxID=222816 RepID=UPI0006255F17|nr:nuclear receptor-binding protein homolog [Orussus abietinus]XP_012282698.1 nuclear receptor-binding protein homolog [Orussus abietinus]XP_012282699.1 nuclear receptor-binding protein homolog [Orussus abietinus]XP_012282700.1 nuclear receptor-binding protein homolog [Orussus abietinus]
MPGSRASTDPEHKSPRESGEDSEDESEILEESPCGRWLKRREEVYVGTKSALSEGSSYGPSTRGGESEVAEMEVEQRDVPGIDCAYLAMDTEEGVEVVWNEVQFSERKNFKAQEEKIQLVFENLTQLEHPNIVKFHRYWTDTHNDKPRVIFITEYMSSGSLKQFLKRTKRNVKKLPLQAWKRWCTQILSALSYLHSCSPPIIHGNLTCDTIFIQHNGLVKVGSVAPDAIHHHVKTFRANMKNMHFVAPEYGNSVTPAIDIYSFGMCALEMAALEIQGNGDSGTVVTEENVRKTIESLDDAQQKDFISKCLQTDPLCRPSARELLFHPVLFEVHSLKLLAAHALVMSATNISETITDEVLQRLYRPDTVVAEIKFAGRPPQQIRLSDIPVAEKLEKFVEDVKYGIYPLTAFMAKLPPPVRPRAISPEVTESVKSVTPEPVDVESRRVVNMMCNVKPREESCELLMTILLRMDDKMNRQLTCPVTQVDTSMLLAQELVHFGFINENDRDKIGNLIEEALRSCFNKQLMSPGMVSLTNLPTQATLLLSGPEFPCMEHLENSVGHATASSSDSVTSVKAAARSLDLAGYSYRSTNAHEETSVEPPVISESGS